MKINACWIGQRFTSWDGQNFFLSQVKGTGRISFLYVKANERISYGVEGGNFRHPYIVSGVFEISFPLPANYNVTNGRFDMVVNPGTNFAVSP